VAPETPPPAPEQQGVTIEIVGAPEGARILYDGTPVPVNPFPVDRKATLARLEVQAEGFEPFTTAVIPSDDLKVEVALKPLAQQPEKTPRGASHRSGTSGRAAAEGPPKSAPDPGAGLNVKDGKRGTKFGGEFE
jgi:hypothetical protein